MESTFENVFLPLANQLLAFCNFLTRDEAEADDLCQDAMVKAFQAFKTFQPGTNAKAWIFTIARNTFINNKRKISRTGRTLDLEDALGIQASDENLVVVDDVMDLNFEVFSHVLPDELYSAMLKLDHNKRILMILAHVYDFHYEELSAFFDIPIGTVRSRLHRTKQELHQLLSPYALRKGYKN